MLSRWGGDGEVYLLPGSEGGRECEMEGGRWSQVLGYRKGRRGGRKDVAEISVLVLIVSLC